MRFDPHRPLRILYEPTHAEASRVRENGENRSSTAAATWAREGPKISAAYKSTPVSGQQAIWLENRGVRFVRRIPRERYQPPETVCRPALGLSPVPAASPPAVPRRISATSFESHPTQQKQVGAPPTAVQLYRTDLAPSMHCAPHAPPGHSAGTQRHPRPQRPRRCPDPVGAGKDPILRRRCEGLTQNCADLQDVLLIARRLALKELSVIVRTGETRRSVETRTDVNALSAITQVRVPYGSDVWHGRPCSRALCLCVRRSPVPATARTRLVHNHIVQPGTAVGAKHHGRAVCFIHHDDPHAVHRDLARNLPTRRTANLTAVATATSSTTLPSDAARRTPHATSRAPRRPALQGHP
jgi:hypothetical protein